MGIYDDEGRCIRCIYSEPTKEGYICTNKDSPMYMKKINKYDRCSKEEDR